MLGVIGQVLHSVCQRRARGTVVMRFDRCAYIQVDRQLICIGLNELGASSITGLFDRAVRMLPQSLTIGASVQFSPQYLSVDDRYVVDVRVASLYESELQDKLNKLTCVTKLTTQHELLANLKIPSAGLAPLLQHFTVATTSAESTSTVNLIGIDSEFIDSEFIDFAMPLIVQLAKQIWLCCANGDSETVHHEFDSKRFQKLVGAGPGLTPSGDDFLCGVFTALRLSGFHKVADALWTSIRSVALLSTTPVSVAMMEQATLGDSGEHLDAVVQAYYGYPLTTASDFQRLIALVGETSGWDWLSGFVWCGDILRHIQTENSERFDLI